MLEIPMIEEQDDKSNDGSTVTENDFEEVQQEEIVP